MPRCVVYTGWDGCGTTAAFSFFNSVGIPLGWRGSQWVTSPYESVSKSMKLGKDLDEIWETDVKPYLINTDFGGFSGWPYSLFYKQWDRDYDTVFVHAKRNVESWAYTEIGSHYSRSVPLDAYQEHVDYIYGVRLTKTSSLDVWQKWIDRYKKHNIEVEDYFSTRSDKYLYINLDDTSNEDVGMGICSLMRIEYNGQLFPIELNINPAEWNSKHIQKLVAEDEYQELWNSRKSYLFL